MVSLMVSSNLLNLIPIYNNDLLILFSSTHSKMAAHEPLRTYLKRYKIRYKNHSWMDFHQNIAEPHKEKSSTTIIEDVLDFEKSERKR